MSPEQAQLAVRPVDRRTDVYSLGVTLYEGLTGRRPFEGTSVFAVLDAIRTHQPAPLTQFVPRIAREVEAVVEQAMAKEPGERYANAFDLAHDLDALATGDSPQAAARRGSEWARFRRAWCAGRKGHTVEYRTRAQFLGWPLIHMHMGPRRGGGMRTARGWIATGERAVGFLAMGGIAFGVFAWGGIAAGLFTFGGLAIGGAVWGGIAVGGLAVGGISIGYVAVGGFAAGIYAWGGLAHTVFVVDEAQRQAWSDFFGRWFSRSG